MTSVLDHGRQPTRTTWLAGGIATTILLAAAGLIGTAGTAEAAAATAVPQGTTESFAVLAATGITNTGPTTINGDTGSFPDASVTDNGVITQTGVPQGGNGVTQQAQLDLDAAYVNTAGQGPADRVPADLADVPTRTLVPGVYDNPTALELTGPLTLDAQGDPSAVFVFQSGSSLITAPDSTITLIGGAQACNVFWQVTSSATLGTNSTFVGTVYANTAIQAQTGAVVQGRLLARNAAVTLDSNVITAPTCAIPPTSSAPVTTSAAPTSAAPTTSAGPTTTPAGGPGSPGGPTGSGSGGTPGAGTPTGAGGTGGNGGGGGNGTRGTGSFSQVGTVPVGSVDTGDGSAAGPPSTP